METKRGTALCQVLWAAAAAAHAWVEGQILDSLILWTARCLPGRVELRLPRLPPYSSTRFTWQTFDLQKRNKADGAALFLISVPRTGGSLRSSSPLDNLRGLRPATTGRAFHHHQVSIPTLNLNSRHLLDAIVYFHFLMVTSATHCHYPPRTIKWIVLLVVSMEMALSQFLAYWTGYVLFAVRVWCLPPNSFLMEDCWSSEMQYNMHGEQSTLHLYLSMSLIRS